MMQLSQIFLSIAFASFFQKDLDQAITLPYDSNNESCSPQHGINHADYIEVHPMASYFLLIDLVDKGA